MIAYRDALEIADNRAREAGYDIGSLPWPIQVVYAVGQLDFEVTNGGVHGWLTNGSGRHAVETAKALDAIGATTCADLVRQILAFLPGGQPALDDVERVRQIEKVLPIAEPAWRELGNSLLEWPDDVDTLLRRYVEANADLFEFARVRPPR
jgi:hypothetical protein